MLQFAPGVKVYLACKPVDMRRGFDGLAADVAGPGMPSFAWKLSDDQAAAVLTYIRNSWGASAPIVEASQIAQARKRASMASGH